MALEWLITKQYINQNKKEVILTETFYYTQKNTILQTSETKSIAKNGVCTFSFDNPTLFLNISSAS